MLVMSLLAGGLFADAQRVHLNWSWPFTGASSGALAIDASRHYAFYSAGMGIVGVDLYNSPYSIVGRIFTSNTALDIKISPDGNTLFAAVGDSGIDIWNISDTANPARIARINDGNIVFVKVHGNYLFASDTNSASVKIYDISTLSSPSLVSTFDLPNGKPGEMEVVGTVLYVAGYTGGTYVFDISNASSPTLIATLNQAAWHTYIDAANNRLFTGIFNGPGVGSTINYYDITNPSIPSFLFSETISAYPTFQMWDFAASSDTLFLISSGNGVSTRQIIWEGDSTIPLLSNSDGSLDDARGIALFEDKVLAVSDNYISGTLYELSRTNLNISDSANPIGWISDVWVNGDYAYVAGAGILTFHIVGDTMEFIGQTLSETMFDRLMVRGSYLLASSGDSIYLFSIGANPQSPSLLGKFYSGGDLGGFDAVVTHKGLYIYTAVTNTAVFFVFDASNPSSPTMLYDVPVAYTSNDIKVMNDLAYLVSSYGDRFMVYDINDSSQVASIYYEDPFGLELRGNYAYVVGNRPGIVDISDPSNPHIVGNILFNGNSWTAYDVCPFDSGAVFIGNIYLSNGSGFVIVDMRDTSNIRTPGYLLYNGGYGRGVFFKDYKIYAAFYDLGLHAFTSDSLPPQPAPVVLVEPTGGQWAPRNVHFEWQDTTGVTGAYYILKAYGSFYIIDDTLTTTYFDTVLTQKRRYWWYVITYYAPGYDARTYTTSFYLDPDPPFGFNLLSPDSGASISDSIVSFDWSEAQDTSSGMGHYLLLISNDSTFASYDSFVVDTSGMSVALASYGTFYWKVIAVDSAGNTAESNVWSFTREMPTPSVPGLVSPIGGTWLNDTTVAFSWTTGGKKVSDTGFIGKFRHKGALQKDLLDGPTSKDTGIKYDLRFVIEILSGNTTVVYDTVDTNFVEIPLSEGTYRWHVKAFYVGAGASDWSPTDSFGVDTTPPSAVSLTSPENGVYLNSTTVHFDWADAVDTLSGVASYLLLVSQSPDFSSADSFFCTSSETTLTLAEMSYWWRVQAFDHAGNGSGFTDAWSFEVDTTHPEAPALILPVGGTWLSDTSVVLSWSAVSFKSGKPAIKAAPVSYIFEVSSNGSVVVTDTVDTNVAHVTLFEGFYTWRVMAFDGAGNTSPWSHVDSFGIDITPPEIDSMTIWSDTSWFFGPYEVHAWITDNLSGVQDVWLFYSIDGQGYDSTQMNESYSGWIGEIPAFSDSANHSVSYFVRANDSSQPPNHSLSDTVSFEVTSIEEGNIDPSVYAVSLRSTVASEIVFEVKTPSSTPYRLEIYSTDGRLVGLKTGHLNRGYSSLSVNLSTNGVYMAVLRTKFGTEIRKLVILK